MERVFGGVGKLAGLFPGAVYNGGGTIVRQDDGAIPDVRRFGEENTPPYRSFVIGANQPAADRFVDAGSLRLQCSISNGQRAGYAVVRSDRQIGKEVGVIHRSTFAADAMGDRRRNNRLNGTGRLLRVGTNRWRVISGRTDGWWIRIAGAEHGHQHPWGKALHQWSSLIRTASSLSSWTSSPVATRRSPARRATSVETGRSSRRI